MTARQVDLVGTRSHLSVVGSQLGLDERKCVELAEWVS